MSYKYITENNLEHKQTYMYSEYGGMNFLLEYECIRQEFIKKYPSDNLSIEEFFSTLFLTLSWGISNSSDKTFITLSGFFI